MSDHDYEIPNDDTVSPDDIQPEAKLAKADLSEASLIHADLSGADLSGTNLSGATLEETDLSDAMLFGADLSDADLMLADLSDVESRKADFSGANLCGADLSGADLYKTDLSGADLRSADLSNADIRSVNLSESYVQGISLTDTKLNRETYFDDPSDLIEDRFSGIETYPRKYDYDIIARMNHELQSAYSTNGLISQARTARVRERRARRREAKAEGGWHGTVVWGGSLLSRVVTGYGVRLRSIVGAMLLLYVSSALVYWYWAGMSWDYSLYYSVVTFTTSPPETPPSGLSRIVASIETFGGTAAIVLLGYVIGTRERV